MSKIPVHSQRIGDIRWNLQVSNLTSRQLTNERKEAVAGGSKRDFGSLKNVSLSQLSQLIQDLRFSEISCVEVTNDQPDGTQYKYIGDAHTPVVVDPKSEKVTECLSRIKLSVDGRVISEDKGSEEYPLTFDLESGNIIRCLSRVYNYSSRALILYTGSGNVPVQFDPISGIVSQCLLFERTFPDGPSMQYMGGGDIPITFTQLETGQLSIKQCLVHIRTERDGSVRTCNGTEQTPIKFGLESGRIEQCLSCLLTRPNGRGRMEFIGDDQAPVVFMSEPESARMSVRCLTFSRKYPTGRTIVYKGTASSPVVRDPNGKVSKYESMVIDHMVTDDPNASSYCIIS